MRNIVVVIVVGFAAGVLGGYAYHQLNRVDNEDLRVTTIAEISSPNLDQEPNRLASYYPTPINNTRALSDDFVLNVSEGTCEGIEGGKLQD